MPVKKSILQEAIAEAKTVRQAAVENAYKQLEESLTPSIKSMLEQKLERDVDLDENEEESLEESNVNSGFKEVKTSKKNIKEVDTKDDDTEEEPDGDENGGKASGDHPEPDGDEPEVGTEEPDGDEDGGEASGDHPEPDGDEPEEGGEEGEISDDSKIEDLTVGELRGLITDMVAQINGTAGQTAPEGDEGADMDAGDVEGQGDEDAPVEGDIEAGDLEDPDRKPKEEDDDNEINLAEILKELEEEEKNKSGKSAGCCSCDSTLEEVKKERDRAIRDRDRAYSVVNDLKESMRDVNLLNAKLLYTTRMLRKPLSESQKVQVIESIDKAKTLREVKLIAKTLTESLGSKSTSPLLKEHRMELRNRGLASRAAGSSTAPNQGIVEVDDTVRRMQQLAGIIS